MLLSPFSHQSDTYTVVAPINSIGFIQVSKSPGVHNSVERHRRLSSAFYPQSLCKAGHVVLKVYSNALNIEISWVYERGRFSNHIALLAVTACPIITYLKCIWACILRHHKIILVNCNIAIKFSYIDSKQLVFWFCFCFFYLFHSRHSALGAALLVWHFRYLL